MTACDLEESSPIVFSIVDLLKSSWNGLNVYSIQRIVLMYCTIVCALCTVSVYSAVVDD